jgi:glycosyltransferase involved in cell wall biosynthesis
MNTLAPLLSVTVLNYNYGHYLDQCLSSVLSQTLTDFELILINDCSTDDSLAVIEPYLADPRVRLVNHDVNCGYVASLREGCTLSRGRYLTVVSADDYALDKDAFAHLCRVLDADPAIGFCYSAWQEVDDEGHVRHERRGAEQGYVHAGVVEVRRLLKSSPILHSGTAIRREAYDAVGGYDAACRYSVDTNMWLALCAVGKVAYIPDFLFAYRAHQSNMSQSGGSLWQATQEMLHGIDTALARFDETDLPDCARLRRQAQQRALVAVPTLDIFAGRIARGWIGFLRAARRYPWLTAGQVRTLALLLRTLLGPRLYSSLTERRKNTVKKAALTKTTGNYA